MFFGVYKDNNENQKYQFYFDFSLILLGLFIESRCIEWLKNRFGCNYFKF